MFHRSVAAIAAVVVASLAATAQSQPPSTQLRPDPLDPQAAVPSFRPASALSRYRAAGKVEVGDWKAANDTVTRIGGWRTYAREAAAVELPLPAPAPAAAGAAPANVAPVPAAAASAAGPHHRHGGGSR